MTKVNPADQLAASGKRSIDIPYGVLVRRADPDYDKDRRSQTEYVFGGRVSKKANPAQRGAYKPAS